MGKTGKAITFACEQDVYELPAIERYIGNKIPSETATEELFAEDLSDGKRIHTEYYEERGGRDEGRPRARHRDRDGRDKRPSASRTRGPRAGGQRDTGHRAGGQRASGPQDHERGKHRAGPREHIKAEPIDVNLSELSLEERMAYYKRKYDKSGSSQAAKGGGKPRDKTGKRNRHRGRDKQAAPDQSSSRETCPPETVKKGLFSKLLGIFKKK